MTKRHLWNSEDYVILFLPCEYDHHTQKIKICSRLYRVSDWFQKIHCLKYDCTGQVHRKCYKPILENAIFIDMK